MVAWIVNDLSAGGQYAALDDFLTDFEGLLAAARELRKAGHSVSCARPLRYRQITAETTVLDAVHTIPVLERRYLALAWLTKGPFWTSPPEGEGVVYRHVEDVTEQGLGEAARRRWLGEDARSFSFRGLPDFEVAVLEVQCLRAGAEAIEISSVPNAWEIATLRDIVPTVAEPTGWMGMVDEACARFAGLQIARDQIVEEMSKYPFDKGAKNRLLEILTWLNELSLARTEHGDGSAEVAAWLQRYAGSARAAFSSEKPKNPAVFEFPDPFSGRKIYCPWHGKVHNPLQYRVHYEWPAPQGQRQIKVLFIGEKITKR